MVREQPDAWLQMRQTASQLGTDPDACTPQLSRIETEKLVMALVEAELAARRAAGTYAGKFAGLAHYFGYEGRCALPTNFDATCACATALGFWGYHGHDCRPGALLWL